MSLRIKFTYHRRFFICLVIYSWLLVGCFAIFQYRREKQFKAEELNGRLQVVNEMIIHHLDSTGHVHLPAGDFADLRISVIDKSGTVIYDNTLDSLPGTSHLDREEIVRALRDGEGWTLRRHSRSTGQTYFYSAKRGHDYLVRTAVPYSISLNQLLAADYAFLWFLVGVTIIMCVLGFIATRRIGMYMENRQALHEQQEKNRIKRQLTNNINHELKTPVASMQVCLETMAAHPDMAAEKRTHFINRCLEANRRLSSLLTDVSTLTRIEDGSDNITADNVDVAAIVAEVCNEYRAKAREMNIEIHNNISGPMIIRGNASLISSIFHNLISNSIAYSEGSAIEISADRNGVFRFSDNGRGVAPEHLDKIFERFYRIDKGRSRQLGGTGLGLSIVRNAVLWHGGTITAENRRNGGLLFIFTLSKQQ